MQRSPYRRPALQSKPGSTEAHTALLNEILLAIGALPDAFVEKIQVINVPLPSGRWHRSAEDGHPDLQACVRNRRTGLGLMVAGDAKTGGAVLSPEQRAWRDAFVARGGGIFRELRSIQDAIDLINEARNA
jgi:hypothetical protein